MLDKCQDKHNEHFSYGMILNLNPIYSFISFFQECLAKLNEDWYDIL